MSAPRRGEIWLVSLDPTKGHEQAGTRPALVLSADAFNASAANLLTVLPITSKHRVIRTRIEITPPEAGLTMVSYVMCDQTRTIATSRLIKPFGTVTAATMAKVEDVVRMLLGL